MFFFPVQQEIFSMLNYFSHITEVKDLGKGININVLNIEAMIKTCVRMSGRYFNFRKTYFPTSLKGQ